MNLIFSISIFSLLLTSCDNRIQQSENNHTSLLIGKIDSVIIDHAVVKRDWCRFTRVFFVLELYNPTSDTLRIANVPEIDYCNITNTKSLLSLKLTSKIKIHDLKNPCSDSLNPRLSIVDLPKDQLIYPHSIIKIKCILLSNVCGKSLEKILNVYSDILNSPFEIESNKIINDYTISFKKAETFKLILKLDDQLIDDRDMINMRIQEEGLR